MQFPRLVFLGNECFQVNDQEEFDIAIQEGWTENFGDKPQEPVKEQVKEPEFINIENGDIDDELEDFPDSNGMHSNGQNQSIQ